MVALGCRLSGWVAGLLQKSIVKQKDRNKGLNTQLFSRVHRLRLLDVFRQMFDCQMLFDPQRLESTCKRVLYCRVSLEAKQGPSLDGRPNSAGRDVGRPRPVGGAHPSGLCNISNAQTEKGSLSFRAPSFE